jgi:hypothetical protein
MEMSGVTSPVIIQRFASAGQHREHGLRFYVDGSSDSNEAHSLDTLCWEMRKVGSKDMDRGSRKWLEIKPKPHFDNMSIGCSRLVY